MGDNHDDYAESIRELAEFVGLGESGLSFRDFRTRVEDLAARDRPAIIGRDALESTANWRRTIKRIRALHEREVTLSDGQLVRIMIDHEAKNRRYHRILVEELPPRAAPQQLPQEAPLREVKLVQAARNPVRKASRAYYRAPCVPIVERVRKYLATMDKAVSGQRGHDTTFRVACALVQGFGLSPTEALPLMQEYNATLDEQWTERELQHKLPHSFINRGKNPKKIVAGAFGIRLIWNLPKHQTLQPKSHLQ